jgi:single-strand DNA-binding protein
MGDLNSVVLVGRLVDDADLKYTKDGTAVSKFRLASNFYQGREKEDGVSFFDVTSWGKQAEGLNQYLTKGRRIGVQGELRQERWEKDGQKQSRVTITAQSIQLLDSKEATEQKPQPAQPQPKRQEVRQPEFAGPEDFEEDIPF